MGRRKTGGRGKTYLRDRECPRVRYQLSAVHIKCDQSSFHFAIRRSTLLLLLSPMVRLATTATLFCYGGKKFFSFSSTRPSLAHNVSIANLFPIAYEKPDHEERHELEDRNIGSFWKKFHDLILYCRNKKNHAILSLKECLTRKKKFSVP